MAYSPVPAKNTGDTWSAADHNTYVKDNFAAGVPDIFTSKGDLPVASGVDAAGRLGVGANGQTLIADSSQALGMKWADGVPGMFTAKGDLAAGTGADAGARLGVGANGQILTADSGEALGLKWVSLIAHRQGGSSSNWNTPGSTNYTPGAVLIQVGTARITLTNEFVDAVVITFPQAFSNSPAIILGGISLISGSLDGTLTDLRKTSISASGFTAAIYLNNYVTATIDFCWIAIGPS